MYDSLNIKLADHTQIDLQNGIEFTQNGSQNKANYRKDSMQQSFFFN